MVHLIDIRRVEVGPQYLTARVRVAMSAPLMTSEDLEGTTRIYQLFPHIIEHVCLGDNSETFKDVMGDTEIAHLLEHVTVEILAQTNIAGNVTYGRTFAVEGEARTYDIEFPCPDDALVIGALSSAVWILQWAYSGGGEPVPDVYATIDGLVNLVESLPEPPLPQPSIREYVVEGDEAIRILTELGLYEPASEPAETNEPWVDDELDEPDWFIEDVAVVDDVADEVPEVAEEVEAAEDVAEAVEDVVEETEAAVESEAEHELVAEIEQVVEAEPEQAPEQVPEPEIVDDVVEEVEVIEDVVENDVVDEATEEVAEEVAEEPADDLADEVMGEQVELDEPVAQAVEEPEAELEPEPMAELEPEVEFESEQDFEQEVMGVLVEEPEYDLEPEPEPEPAPEPEPQPEYDIEPLVEDEYDDYDDLDATIVSKPLVIPEPTRDED